MGYSTTELTNLRPNKDIENKETIKDLGVHVTSDCTFSEHIKMCQSNPENCSMDTTNICQQGEENSQGTSKEPHCA